MSWICGRGLLAALGTRARALGTRRRLSANRAMQKARACLAAGCSGARANGRRMARAGEAKRGARARRVKEVQAWSARRGLECARCGRGRAWRRRRWMLRGGGDGVPQAAALEVWMPGRAHERGGVRRASCVQEAQRVDRTDADAARDVSPCRMGVYGCEARHGRVWCARRVREAQAWSARRGVECVEGARPAEAGVGVGVGVVLRARRDGQRRRVYGGDAAMACGRRGPSCAPASSVCGWCDTMLASPRGAEAARHGTLEKYARNVDAELVVARVVHLVDAGRERYRRGSCAARPSAGGFCGRWSVRLTGGVFARGLWM
ncbi:hypothetical protein DFH09DRAFT_1097077 [Mycena vulgaris]|nr:hypothetical protein DFH09DRAFT_1097077 [Mycena vulgaris]